MSYTDIDDPTLYFNTVLYTGNFTDNHSITGVGFQPDLVWTKNRTDSGEWNSLFDVIRGVGKRIYSNETNAEETATDSLISFDSDGFTLNADNNVNKSGKNFVSWNWKAGGTGSSNTDGSITSTVSANTTSGFSIVSYTGNDTAGSTIGHGLGVAPRMILCKRLVGSASNWAVYHGSLGATKYLKLDTTVASATSSSRWNDVEPTSSVFTVAGNGDTNSGSGNTFVAYCFAEKKGFSKFGNFTGNGNADGTFIYTGFKPAFCIIKRTDSDGYSWATYDSTRYPENKSTIPALWSNLSDAEGSYSTIDFLSNGLKIRDTSATINASGGSYIYMAFASEPFTTSTGIPCTAR